MSNVTPMNTHTHTELAELAEKLVAMGESVVVLARTPSQAAHMQARLDEMKKDRDTLVERARRLEGYRG